MRVCVFGAGAIGGQIAARLARGGADVSLVMRGEHLEATRRNGLRVIAADGEWSGRLPASDAPAEFGPQDLVVVAVKQPSLPAVAESIRPLLGPKTAVAFVMNGLPWWYFHRSGGPREGMRIEALDPGAALWNAVGAERVIGGVAYAAADIVAPGVVKAANANGRLILGEPDGTRSERVESLAGLLRAGGMQATVSEAIRDEVWIKVINNLVSGSLAMTSQTALCDVYSDPSCIAAAHAAVAEMSAVAQALGAHPDVDAAREVARGVVLKRKPSGLQDLEAGRTIEIGAVYEAPLALARLAGVPTPTADLLVALTRLRAIAAGSHRPAAGEGRTSARLPAEASVH